MGSETRTRLGLLGLLVVTLLSFARVFSTGHHFGPALLGILIATALAIGARRLGAGSAASTGLSAAGLLWYLCLVFESKSLFFGLPTPTAAAAVFNSVTRSLRFMELDFAPVVERRGYVIMVVAGMWMATTLAELATFRWRRPLIATGGAMGLFAIVTMVGAGPGASLVASIFLVALLTFWGLESAHRIRSWGRWVSVWAGKEDEPRALTGSVARRMAGATIVLSLILPLGLPNIGEGLLAWRSGKGKGPGSGGGGTSSGRINLLVSIAPQLIEQSGRRMFVVSADKATYWRLASLSSFDGQTWEPLESQRPLPLEEVRTHDARTTPFARPRSARTITQTFTLDGLEGGKLPAASVPHSVNLLSDGIRDDDDVLFDPETGELDIPNGIVGAIEYRVRSYIPDVSFRELREAHVGNPQNPVYTDIPDLSEDVDDLLQRWTEGADTPAERLIAIQDKLRGFEYTTNVQNKATTDYLTQFLTQTRRGYCQQFATAFAVLARQLGYPTRVSVGFLPGQQPFEGVQGFSYAQAQAILPEGGTFTVRGDDAHAWPEVYFQEYGWVPFEPTPRAGVGAPSYTFPTGGSGAGALAGGATGGGDVPNPDALGGSERVRAPRPGEVSIGDRLRGRGDPIWERTFERLVLGLLVALFLFLVTVPLLKEWRIRNRYRRARAPSELALASFAHFQAEAAELASPRRPAESALRFATRLGSLARAPRQSALSLAGLYEAAEYSPAGVSDDDAAKTRRLATQLRRALWQSASWWQRGARLFSPRSLIGR